MNGFLKHYYFVTLFFLFFFPIAIYAAQPDGVTGTLVFVGRTNDLSQSVWLSLTSAGSFKLEAQGNQVVDSWEEESPDGSRISLSPFVSQGNGGTHQLINASNNKILDSQNQNNDVILPPFPTLPPDTIPPYPEHPIFTPPGTPPEGGGVPAHPIVIPPGSTLPPGGGTPTHPIAIPPVLSSQGGSSSSSGRSSPPSNTNLFGLATLSNKELNKSNSTVNKYIKSRRTMRPQKIANKQNRNNNNIKQNTASNTLENNMGLISTYNVPTTRGRQFTQQSEWNIWSDNRYFNIKDTRKGTNTKGSSFYFAIGADRHISCDLVAGWQATLLNFNTRAFNDALQNRSYGLSTGPYFGWQITKKWTMDGYLSYGLLQNKNKISILDSEYRTQFYNGTLHTIGFFECDCIGVRPQVLVSYTHFRNPDYQLKGNIRSIAIVVDRQADCFNFGYAQLKIEANRTFKSKNGNVIQPYSEIGANYAFARPNNGQILTGNLTLAAVSPFTEFVTTGVRTLLAKSFLIDVNGGYLRQKDLNVWSARLTASYSFG